MYYCCCYHYYYHHHHHHDKHKKRNNKINDKIFASKKLSSHRTCELKNKQKKNLFLKFSTILPIISSSIIDNKLLINNNNTKKLILKQQTKKTFNLSTTKTSIRLQQSSIIKSNIRNTGSVLKSNFGTNTKQQQQKEREREKKRNNHFSKKYSDHYDDDRETTVTRLFRQNKISKQKQKQNCDPVQNLSPSSSSLLSYSATMISRQSSKSAMNQTSQIKTICGPALLKEKNSLSLFNIENDSRAYPNSSNYGGSMISLTSNSKII